MLDAAIETSMSLVRQTSRRSLISIGLVVAVSGCSVTDYEQPISEFAAATEQAESALIDLNEQVTEAYADRLMKLAIDKKGFVKIQSGDCQTSSVRCRVELHLQSGTVEPLTPDPALRKMIAIIGSIRTYADSLAAIVAADTATKIETQVNGTIGSVEKLAKTVQSIGGGEKASVDLSEYTTPTGQLVNWVVGQYIASVKLKGLKRATKDAKNVVSAAASIFTVAASASSTVPKKSMAEVVSKNVDAFRVNVTEANLKKLIESAASYDQWLLAKPSGVFEKLAEAHGTLVDKLQGEDISLAVVIEHIKTFSAEAKTVSEIMKAFVAANDSASK